MHTFVTCKDSNILYLYQLFINRSVNSYWTAVSSDKLRKLECTGNAFLIRVAAKKQTTMKHSGNLKEAGALVGNLLGQIQMRQIASSSYREATRIEAVGYEWSPRISTPHNII